MIASSVAAAPMVWPMVALIEFTGTECFFVIDGQRVAKRENRHWIPLEPDFSMHDNLYGGDIDALDKCRGGTQ